LPVGANWPEKCFITSNNSCCRFCCSGLRSDGMAVGPNIFMFDIQTSAKSDAVSRGGRQKESAGADFGALLTQRLQSPAVSGSKAASPAQSKRPGPAEGRSRP